jgi:tetratricopeptide (TPR) repeat protein
MATSGSEAKRLFAASLEAHAARDTTRAIALAREAIDADPHHVEALEHLGTLLITRRQRYAEGLKFVERAVAEREDDAGLWYSLGWCREFAAHEIARRGGAGETLEPRALYEAAADAFRRCLELKPGGKLVGDAEDLLDHVENELLRM